MTPSPNFILSINGGSSSVKFALYSLSPLLGESLLGSLESRGEGKWFHRWKNYNSVPDSKEISLAGGYTSLTAYFMDWMESQTSFSKMAAVGHRIVFGGSFVKPQIITEEIIKQLKNNIHYDPEHLPGEISFMELIKNRHPNLVQIACFDTAFHAEMPFESKAFPIPRKYFNLGIHRYGFHGISYEYITEEFTQSFPPGKVPSKIVIAHLGNGSSLAAVLNGKSRDTSMGFTPCSGIPMGNRSGDLDPGLMLYWLDTEKLKSDQINHIVNHESGLLGLSCISSDMRILLESENNDLRSKEAINLFCYQVRKQIGAMAAGLGGIDALIFSGGIGENSPEIRMRICKELKFLGIEIDNLKNETPASIISSTHSKVAIHIIKTKEELRIAIHVLDIIHHTLKDKDYE